MSAPMIRVAVRDKDGNAHSFKIQHEEIQSHEQAIALARDEFPGALAVIATVPVLAVAAEDVAA